jgi:hypothetical protein
MIYSVHPPEEDKKVAAIVEEDKIEYASVDDIFGPS